jgi:RHS repeat-associated protein
VWGTQLLHQSSYNVSYLYDGDGRRVQSSGGASGTRIYWYDEAGQVIMESMQGGSGFLNEYLYVGGQRVARVANLGPIYYYYGDHLGTARLITDGGGTKCYDADYFPWGGEQHVYVNSCAQNYKFTGKERDPDTGSDYFGARWYRNTMARFYSPDDGSDQDANDPQSWNLYTYVRNNPTTLADDDGRSVVICDNSGHCSGAISDDEYAQAQQADKNNIAPSLSSLQNSDTGMGVITNSSGAPVGTVQWTPDNPGIQTLGLAGAMGMAGLKGAATQMALNAVGIGLGRLAAWGIESALAVGTAEETAGAGVEEILAKASSSVGNQNITASSRAAAEEAAQEWVGPGARPILRDGEQVGLKSVDGTKIARWTSAGKPRAYINLANKLTGGNLHVHF